MHAAGAGTTLLQTLAPLWLPPHATSAPVKMIAERIVPRIFGIVTRSWGWPKMSESIYGALERHASRGRCLCAARFVRTKGELVEHEHHRCDQEQRRDPECAVRAVVA